MELACCLKKNPIKAALEWTPCLAKVDTKGFDPCLRCDILPSEIVWPILPDTKKLADSMMVVTIPEFLYKAQRYSHPV